MFSVAVCNAVRFVVASRDDILFQCSDHQMAMAGTRLVGPLADLQKTARQRSFGCIHSSTSSRLYWKRSVSVAVSRNVSFLTQLFVFIIQFT